MKETMETLWSDCTLSPLVDQILNFLSSFDCIWCLFHFLIRIIYFPSFSQQKLFTSFTHEIRTYARGDRNRDRDRDRPIESRTRGCCVSLKVHEDDSQENLSEIISLTKLTSWPDWFTISGSNRCSGLNRCFSPLTFTSCPLTLSKEVFLSLVFESCVPEISN